MSTLILLMLVLTFAARSDVGAPAARRVWQHLRETMDGASARRCRNAALGLAALAFVAAHVAHDVQTPNTALTIGGQDEIAWVVQHNAPQAARATETARLDAPVAHESD